MRNNKPILLVEDDDIDAENVIRAFKRNKITNPLFIAENGEEALNFLFHKDKYEDLGRYPRPCIILLDLNMPVMSGIEFLEAVKADYHLKRIPVVVLTSSKAEEDVVKSYDLQASAYVSKPVDLAGFGEIVRGIEGFWFSVVRFPPGK